MMLWSMGSWEPVPYLLDLDDRENCAERMFPERSRRVPA